MAEGDAEDNCAFASAVPVSDAPPPLANFAIVAHFAVHFVHVVIDLYRATSSVVIIVASITAVINSGSDPRTERRRRGASPCTVDGR